jgi:DNA-nicking Smr family endonuclease
MSGAPPPHEPDPGTNPSASCSDAAPALVTGEPGSEPEGAVLIPITGELDLHAFAPRDIPSVVEDYLEACRERGLLEVRLVHGRGKGVQRAVVQRVLRSLPEVEAFGDAPPGSGAWGATLVRLRAAGA